MKRGMTAAAFQSLGISDNMKERLDNNKINIHLKSEDTLRLESLNLFFKQKTAYEIGVRLVGSEMCIREQTWTRTNQLGLTIWTLYF